VRVILFGATGMVGQGVLRECLFDARVTAVLSVGRTKLEQTHEKLTDLVVKDLFDLSAVEAQLAGADACFFCLGVSSAGLSEEAYTRITYELTLSAAKTLSRLNPQMTFIYVSGAGTDSSEQGRSMWARVKGRTENALLQLPFGAAWMFRPGLIQPLHGIRSKTSLYRAAYAVTSPLFPLLDKLAPKVVTTTERVGKAMLEAAEHGAPTRFLENADINALAARRA